MSDPDDLTREDQLAVDLSTVFDDGLHDDDGALRGELQGEGSTAAALQLGEAGLPLEMLGRLLTMLRSGDLDAARRDLDVIVEEPAKRGQPLLESLVRSGVAACEGDDDLALLLTWLSNVYALLALQEAP